MAKPKDAVHLDLEELPEALRKKISGESDWPDDEPTQVTKLLEELGECASDTKDELAKTGRTARAVSRLTKRKNKSYPKLKMLLSDRPPPPPHSEEGKGK
jgi:hypothetical protein